jgi:glutamate-5-semialdehyde dehydrogenase
MHQKVVKKMILEICQNAKSASVELAKASAELRNKALCSMADSLERNCQQILAANKEDVAAARTKGTKESLIDRLIVDEKRVKIWRLICVK